MNLGQAIDPERVEKARTDRPREPAPRPAMGTVNHINGVSQQVKAPEERAPAPPAPVATPAKTRAPMRLGVTAAIYTVLAQAPAAGFTAAEINQRLAESCYNISALLADPRKRGDVEAYGEPRHFRYRLTAKGRARV